MRLLSATGEDTADVAALEQLLFGVDAWSPAVVRTELTGPGRRAVVLREDQDVLAGYAVTLRSGDVVDLQRIAVHPQRRRQGLARTLLGAVVSPDDPAALLEVSERNEGALAFYAAVGFTPISHRRAYYRDGSDAVVLRRSGAPMPAAGPGEENGAHERL